MAYPFRRRGTQGRDTQRRLIEAAAENDSPDTTPSTGSTYGPLRYDVIARGTLETQAYQRTLQHGAAGSPLHTQGSGEHTDVVDEEVTRWRDKASFEHWQEETTAARRDPRHPYWRSEEEIEAKKQDREELRRLTDSVSHRLQLASGFGIPTDMEHQQPSDEESSGDSVVTAIKIPSDLGTEISEPDRSTFLGDKDKELQDARTETYRILYPPGSALAEPRQRLMWKRANQNLRALGMNVDDPEHQALNASMGIDIDGGVSRVRTGGGLTKYLEKTRLERRYGAVEDKYDRRLGDLKKRVRDGEIENEYLEYVKKEFNAIHDIYNTIIINLDEMKETVREFEKLATAIRERIEESDRNEREKERERMRGRALEYFD